ncbi:DBH-like monooxygenase 1 -like protein [Brachionus plicatilis]|uniref:DBH-like monooxygenase 1-like protein n=1 Tax=Brachionus plicatilis TaxID=10195 RepID=A0A3M7SLB3_BRAPC|nr:DBH-like monooxygenase 1 -like protein [Brachionus plicatilis]
MWPKNILVLLIALNFASARNRLLTPLVPSEDYAFHLSIDSRRPDFLNMHWKMVNDEIQIEIHCQTSGYVAFGLSPDGKMPKSDIVIGWVDSSGSYLFVRLIQRIDRNFKDTFASFKSSPKKDSQQDWTLLEAREVNGFTMLKMKRKLITGDPSDRDITNDATYLIFAWNNQDPVLQNWIYHGPNKRSLYTSLFHLKKFIFVRLQYINAYINAFRQDFDLLQKCENYYF